MAEDKRQCRLQYAKSGSRTRTTIVLANDCRWALHDHVETASCGSGYVSVAPVRAPSTVVGHPSAIVKTTPDTFQDGEQLSRPFRDPFCAILLQNNARTTDDGAGWQLLVSDAPRDSRDTLAKPLVFIDEEAKK